MGTDNRLQVRIDDNLTEWLARRAFLMHNGGDPDSPAVQARIELGLWKAALDLELRRIRLTLPQARVIIAVCNTLTLDAAIGAGPGLVYAACYDAFRIAREKDRLGISSYAAQYGIDEQELLDYLGGLGPAADAALRDAITRWWEDDGREDTVDGFGKVGLRVTDTETAEAAQITEAGHG
jgi:hypothetical protein